MLAPPKSSLILIFASWIIQLCDSATPIVLWHGMGDSCCMPWSLGPFKKYLENEIGDVYVKSLRIGNSNVADFENSYFKHPNKQVEIACKQIADDPKLADGFNAIGFSQGAQFLRAVLQRCRRQIPTMFNLISLGGQHQGVYGLPGCGSLQGGACDYIRRLLNHAAYEKWVQNLLVQATYWHDPLNEDLYKQSSQFIAEINNEVTQNERYSENINTLNKFVMVKFGEDSMVQPKETEWFGFYKPGQAVEVVPMNETDLYTKDYLGLQLMNSKGSLVFLTAPGDHLQFTEEWFTTNIIDNYLR